MKKSLLLNWVYYLPAGHVVEALRHAYGYHVANKDRVEITVLLNAQAPAELARACPWIKQVYPVSLAEVVEKKEQASCLKAIPKEWDYIINDPRVSPERADPDDDEGLFPTQAVLQPLLRAREWSGYTLGWESGWLDQGIIGQDTPLPFAKNAHVTLPLPAEARQFAERYQHDGLTIVILPVSTAGLAQSPSPSAWEKVCAAFAQAFPGVKMYITGITYVNDTGQREGFDFGPEDAHRIAARVPGVVECFDIGMWNQLALIERGDLFCSPHTGFAFLAPYVGTPWLTISGCPWAEYHFNGVPFYSALTDCPNYPASAHPDSECMRRWFQCVQPDCMKDAEIERRIPDIITGARLLQDPTFTYEQAGRLHIEKFRASGREDVCGLR